MWGNPPWLAKRFTMVVSCWAVGCRNRYGVVKFWCLSYLSSFVNSSLTLLFLLACLHPWFQVVQAFLFIAWTHLFPLSSGTHGNWKKKKQAQATQKNQEDAARDLFQEIDLTADVETQTNQTETSDASTQVSCISEPPITSSPNVCYVPVVSRWSQAADTLGLQLTGNDEGTKFYTGWTSWDVFQYLVSFLSTCCPNLKSIQAKLSRLLLTLMRLRLNLCVEDLVYRFSIAVSTAGDVFHRWIEVMHFHLKFLIKWPTQCRRNMPPIFKDLYTHTLHHWLLRDLYWTMFIYQARAQTCSN